MAGIPCVLARLLWCFLLGWIMYLWSLIDAARSTPPPQSATAPLSHTRLIVLTKMDHASLGLRVLLTRLSQDSNTVRTFLTESEGRHDVECVLVHGCSFGAERSKEGPAHTRRTFLIRHGVHVMGM